MQIPAHSWSFAARTASVTTAENTTLVTTVTATPGETISYVIAGSAYSSHVLVEFCTGVLELLPAPNFEALAGEDWRCRLTIT